MLYLKSWLQEYIKQELPDNEVIIDALNKKAFEVEEVRELSIDNNIKDYIFDLKILPNRASDCLCHLEIAREISACLDLDFVNNDLSTKEYFENNLQKYNKIIHTDKNINININCNNIDIQNISCSRFAGVIVDGIEVKESPLWLKNKLNNIGEKSINNIVDITNYIQFTINKPMHAYDFDNLNGDINVRFANNDEILETLDNRNLELNDKTLIIADNLKPLGLAGIKGGKYSGVNINTKSIFIESANFNNSLIRKTSQKYNIKTDASKRFENGISDNLVIEGIYMMLNLLLQIAQEQGFLNNLKIYTITDNFPNKINFENKLKQTIEVNLEEINKTLGMTKEDNNLITLDKVQYILNKLNIPIINIKSDNTFVVVTTANRLDLNIKEDIIEEIGRINGFINIKSVIPDLSKKRVSKINNYLLLENHLKNIFIQNGFSLVYNYTFTNSGDIKVLKPLSEDKKYLRINLSDGLYECVKKNISNMPLLDLDKIKVFEFGNVFLKSEERRLAFVIDNGKKNSDFNSEINNILTQIKDVLQYKLNINIIDFENKYIVNNINKNIIEINIEKIIQDNIMSFNNLSIDKNIFYPEYQDQIFKYQSFSQMPFIIRDVAFWSNTKLNQDNISQILDNIKSRAGLNSLKISFFDEFQKDFDNITKYSYAYRIIYQNKNKTLTDEEVNIEVQNVYEYLIDQGFEIR